MRNQKEYCTYLTRYSGELLPPWYYGSTYINNITENNYHGSVSSKKHKEIWKKELKDNSHLFRTRILKRFWRRDMALVAENYYQHKFDMINSNKYSNMAYANFRGVSKTIFNDIRQHFQQKLNNSRDINYEIIDEYINAHTKILVAHKRCIKNNFKDYFYEVEARHWISGGRCPKCKTLNKDKQSLIKLNFRIENIIDNMNDNYCIIASPIYNRDKFTMCHKKCKYNNFNDYIYKVKGSKFILGTRCPMCAHNVLAEIMKSKKIKS